MHVAAGTVLVVAAALKAADPAPHLPLARLNPFGRAVTLLTVTEELFLGLWLLSGLLPGAARLLTTFVFACFTLVALGRGVAGEASCGCFGNLSVTPWLAVALDLTLFVLLLAVRVPAPTRETHRTGFALAVIAASAFGATLTVGRSVDQKSRQLAAAPAVVDFGQLAPGDSAQTTVTVFNGTDSTVEVVHVRASCSCVSASPCRWSVEPGQSVGVSISLDFDREPDFTGRLVAPVVGESATGQSMFRLIVVARASR